MNAIKVWALRLFASLGVAGVVAAILALVFFGGELGVACGKKPAPPDEPIVLEDTDAAEEAPRSTVPPGQVGQGLEVLEPDPELTAELEEKFGRVLHDRLLLALKEVPAAPRGGELQVTAPETGGAVDVDFRAASAPKFEWIHETRVRGAVGLPVAGAALADRWSLEAEWFPVRWRDAYFGLRGELEARGGETDTAILALLEFRCRGFGDCEAK